jgi:putative peptide zinc metalloprotease protein
MPVNVWGALKNPREGEGVWRRTLAGPPRVPVPGTLNIWTLFGNRPGGMWQELEGETLLLAAPAKAGLWAELKEETLILKPTGREPWREPVPADPASEPGEGLWSKLGDETLVLAPAGEDVWQSAGRAADYTRYRPLRRLGWALKKLQTASGEEYYMLKNTRSATYLRLTEGQVFLWNLMDGRHSLQDMAVAYFIRFQSLAVEGLWLFLAQLEAKGFLADPRVNLFAHTVAAVSGKRPGDLGRKLWRAFTQTTFSFRNVDRLLTAAYRGGVFVLMARPVQLLMLLVTAAGMAAFAWHFWQGRYSVLTGGGEHLALGLAGLYAAQFAAFLLHEAAHAFTCKHYGREVRQAGVMIYLGMPAFFVDTTDIWMEPRRPRLLVSWAGPYSGFFLAALASLLIFAAPSEFIAGLLYQFAFACSLLSFMNLNPLLMLDGYYILMDWLEMPMLRARALRFVSGDLWRKARRREKFDRDEKIFTVFGLLSLGWTALAVFSVLRLLGTGLYRFLQALLGPLAGQVALALLVLGLATLLLWPFLRNLAGGRRRQAAGG